MTRKPQKLVNRADLSRMAGLSRMAITKACKGKLAAACVGDRIDATHPAVVEYLKGRTPTVVATPVPAPPPPAPKPKKPAKKKAPKTTSAVKAKAPAKKKAPSKKKSGAKRTKVAPTEAKPEAKAPVAEVQMGFPEEIDGLEPYASMTIRELIERFGTRRTFGDWLKALKQIEDVRKTRLDNDETEGTLIDRDVVKTHIYGFIDSIHRRLLRDIPRTAANRVYAAARADQPVEEAERLIHDLIRDQLKPLKATAARNLRKKPRI